MRVYDSYCIEGREERMIVLGLVLLIVGILIKISILYTIGVILLVVGVALMLASTLGHAVGGRKHYY